MIQQITEDEITKYGLGIAGYSEIRQQTVLKTTIQRFRGSFGPLPKTASELFVEVQAEDLGEKRIIKPNVNYFLMTLMWLNSYRSSQEMAGIFKLNIKTVDVKIWLYVDAIQALKDKKVNSAFNEKMFLDFIIRVLTSL
jgi:hypothetical protein